MHGEHRVKFVLFSDLHLDAPFGWAAPAVGRKLRNAVQQTLAKICALAKAEQADALLCAGDLYETEYVTPDTAEALRSAFADLAPMRVFLAPGNHDWYGPDSLYRRVSWSPNVHVFSQARFTPVEVADGYVLWGAAHCAPANTDNLLQGFHAKRAGSNLALFHGSERGLLPAQEEGKAPHAPFREADVRAANLQHAFVGHYHNPKAMQSLTYPGSPQPLAFGEGAGGAVIVQFSDGSMHRSWQDVSTIRFHDLDLNVSGLPSMQAIRDQAAAKISGLQGVARITVQGELAHTVDLKLDDLKAITGALDGLVVRVKDLTLDYDFEAIAAEPTVRGQFVKDVRASAIPPDEKQRILTVGLRAFDGRKDLEPL
jgi:DNA repair protein SbcD/Mre11